MPVTEHWRAYVCTKCRMQCDVKGETALTGRKLWCPDCPDRTAEMTPMGPAWPAVETEIGWLGSRGTALDILTTLTNAVIDCATALSGIKEHLDRRWDPRDPEIW